MKIPIYKKKETHKQLAWDLIEDIEGTLRLVLVDRNSGNQIVNVIRIDDDGLTINKDVSTILGIKGYYDLGELEFGPEGEIKIELEGGS